MKILGFFRTVVPVSVLFYALTPAQAGQFSVLYTFTAGSKGGAPNSSPTYADGAVYGGADSYGAKGYGVAYKVTPSGQGTVLHAFSVIEHGDELSTVNSLLYTDGAFYGTSKKGGSQSEGIVFKLTKSGKLTTLHTFGKGTDGQYPSSPLFLLNGTFYGTTSGGGGNGNGTFFKMTKGGTVTVLHSFGKGADGAAPTGKLLYHAGAFYGTTYGGGSSTGCGTVYKITPAGKETKLHDFIDYKEGMYPQTGLANIGDTLYGTAHGGANFAGTLFKMTLSGKLTLIHTFSGSAADGRQPGGELVFQGNYLYGTTTYGGLLADSSNGDGVIYRVSKAGEYKIVHVFSNAADGANPSSAPINVSGTLYGTTRQGGGASNAGTIYTFKP